MPPTALEVNGGNGMSILQRNNLPRASYLDGRIYVSFPTGVECSFPVEGNDRLSAGSEAQRANIRVSRSGLHWPDIDEDLSFEGLMRGDYGQYVHTH